ncbi:hypothetical protein Ahy_A03g011627 [Arachis hypogaea]|uniref:Transposase MuDR plant domain-containing protein n=1 Tax=Arachis hypogaea TaxID=3818 RepID=A0A445DRA4_ARAHY|nr:hypothetical protein Ahy_A03g011627 [Arachis hypogaea]
MKIPPTLEDDDAFPIFREETRFGELRLEVGMKFKTNMDFKEAVREYCIQEGRRVRFKKNDNVQCRTLCKGEKCPWVIYVSKDSEGVFWQVKTFNDDHTCPRETKNKLANRGKCDLDLNKSSLTRALGDARHIVYGDAVAQYGMVRDYGETLLKCNPGTTMRMTTILHPNPTEEPTFDKMYICLDGCKNGFRAGCRSLIGLDGAFLKIRFGGQILAAIYAIANAIVLVENTDNWRWFLELLHEDLGSYTQNGWCFILDMQKVTMSLLFTGYCILVKVELLRDYFDVTYVRRSFLMADATTDFVYATYGETLISSGKTMNLEDYCGSVQDLLLKRIR